MPESTPTVVIGGGLIGLATARALLRADPSRRVIVLEKEAAPGQHQSTHNSGVLHAGLYYKPGSLKADFAVRGIRAMTAFCRETGQPAPTTPGAFIRCALESLALLYRRTLQQLEQLLGYRFERLHICGGGARNDLLNQFASNALQIPVLAGPIEATAAGNALIQAITLGHVPDFAAARRIVAASFDLREFRPAEARAYTPCPTGQSEICAAGSP